MRIIGLLVLSFTLIASLFHIFHADLNSNVLAVALMVLLASLFSDLKEFNFWGLIGKNKEEKKLQEVAGKEAFFDRKRPKVKSSLIKQVEKNVVQLMDADRGNFLAIFFEIEKLLRIITGILSEKEVTVNNNFSKIIDVLSEKEVLTKDGRQQIESLKWIRDMLVHGREEEISKDILKTGFTVAKDFYEELKNWIDNVVIRKGK